MLRSGGLVAFPTETVYGLGARALHQDEVAKIFAAKERPAGHPLILHVEDVAMARTLASAWPDAAGPLVSAFWPGPLTVIVPRAAHVPLVASGGLDTVGIRVPAHPVALALVRAVGEPLAAPSANAHTHISPTAAEHVVASLGDRVDLVLDAGPCRHGIESTVLDLTCDPPRVLRPGAASLGALVSVNPRVTYGAMTVEDDGARASPGLASKHYAPRARVSLVESVSFEDALQSAREAGETFAAIVHSAGAGRSLRAYGDDSAVVVAVVLPQDAEGYARGLFAALHAADAANAAHVLVERVPDEPAFWAVADRLKRAERR